MGKKVKKDSKLWPPLEFTESPLDKTRNSFNSDHIERDAVQVSRISINEYATKWVTKHFTDFDCQKVKKGRKTSKTKENTVPTRKKKEKNKLTSNPDSSFISTKYVPLQVERKIHVPSKVRLEWSSVLLDSPKEKTIGNKTPEIQNRNKILELTDSESDWSTNKNDGSTYVVLVPDTPESEYGITLKMRQLRELREARRRLF